MERRIIKTLKNSKKEDKNNKKTKVKWSMTDSIKQKQRLERKIKNRKEEIAKIIKVIIWATKILLTKFIQGRVKLKLQKKSRTKENIARNLY